MSARLWEFRDMHEGGASKQYATLRRRQPASGILCESTPAEDAKRPQPAPPLWRFVHIDPGQSGGIFGTDQKTWLDPIFQFAL